MILRLVSLIARRSYKLLILSFLSMLMGGFLFGVIFSSTESAKNYLVKEGKYITGGDIVLTSPYPIQETGLLESIKQNGHIFSSVKIFQAVFTASSGKSQPGAVRLVSKMYPLYGEVTLQDNNTYQVKQGGLYADKEFFEKLSLTVGDKVSLGSTTFTALGIIDTTSDEASLGISFAPRVIIGEEDLPALAPLLSMTRTEYKLYIKENKDNPFTEASLEALRDYARNNRLRFDDARDGPNNLIRGLSSVDNFIGIVLSVALFLVVINVLANLVYVLTKWRKTIALLKVFGATSTSIELIFILLLTALGALSGGIGSLLGWITTRYGFQMVKAYMPFDVVIVSPILVTFLGIFFGVFFIAVVSIPFLRRLKQVQPKELLLNQGSIVVKRSFINLLKEGVYYIPIPLILLGFIYGVTRDINLAIISVSLCVAVFVLSMGLAYGLLSVLYRHKNKLSFIPKSIVSFLYLRHFETLITSASIVVAFLGVFIVASVEKNITTNLSSNVSQSTPALYLIDITKSQLEGVERVVGESFKEYPVVRGRLLTINGRNISELENGGLRREFNMTYRDDLITGEKVVEGIFNDTSIAKNAVSIDREFGDELGGVKIGDTLEVFIQGVTLQATITSIREVDSTSGVPFFYLVFPKEVLSSFPASYFATANVSGNEKVRIQSTLGATYPNIIPIDTSKIIETVTSLLSLVTLIVFIVGLPSIVLGIVLVLVMLYQSLYERSQDVLVLRAFGLTAQKITYLFVLESLGTGLLTGLSAFGIAILIAYLINIYVFSFATFSLSFLPLYMILGVVLVTSLLSYILSLKMRKASLKKLLAEK